MLREVIRRVELLALDIETRAGTPEELELAFRAQWSPNPEWKDETIGKRWRAARQAYLEKAALLDSAEICVVSFCWGPEEYEVLHCLPERAPRAKRLEDEARLLAAIAEALSHLDPDCILAGHNILGFDLPRLRMRMLKLGIDLPSPLVRRDQPVFDTMREWQRFSVEQRPYIALADALEALGIQHHKRYVSGADIAAWLAEERYCDVLQYAAADVVAEFHLAAKMMGIRVQEKTQDDAPLPMAWRR